MAPTEASVDRAALSSALWARSLAVNFLALAACRYLLDGVEVHGVWGYALAAIGIELPTILWWLTYRLLAAKVGSDLSLAAVAASRAASITFLAVVLALAIAVPLALATSVPGLLVAVWISPLRISGYWTWAGACAITTALTLAFRQSRPLRVADAFVTGFAPEQQKLKADESRREFRESRAALGDALAAGLLRWWSTHRSALSWAQRVVRVAALLVGTVTVGFWFGVVLAVIVWLLPAAILWPLVRRVERRRGVTPRRFRLVQGRGAAVRLAVAIVALSGCLLLVYGNRL